MWKDTVSIAYRIVHLKSNGRINPWDLSMYDLEIEKKKSMKKLCTSTYIHIINWRSL